MQVQPYLFDVEVLAAYRKKIVAAGVRVQVRLNGEVISAYERGNG